MRIVIDLQGAQSESRYRGIGRYSLSISKAIVRNKGNHEIIIALSNLFLDTIEDIKEEFKDILPLENIKIWDAVSPVKECEEGNNQRREVSEVLREAYLANLKPDIIIITSLFEGYVDDAVTSIKKFDKNTIVAVIGYDLIPYIYKDKYLVTNELYTNHYLRKLEYLKNADLILGISESSCNEIIDIKNTNAVNISAAVDEIFKPKKISLNDKKIFYKKFNITKKTIVYAPGGFDIRKNFENLIEAYSILPNKIKENYQLVIVSKVDEGNKTRLLDFAKERGIKKNDLILTGYVSDNELISFYSMCDLFVFPSIHEGFGLPVLEAMNCGAVVIGSNTTSIPEVIGIEDALFNPYLVESIAHKIEEVLEDKVLEKKLLEHNIEQIKKFSWDKSAKKAISFMENSFNQNYTYTVSTEEIIQNISKYIQFEYRESELIQIAKAIKNNQDQFVKKQIFLDVSELSQRDSATGVQRVVKSYLKELLLSPPKGYIIKPVYATTNSVYKYSDEFTAKFLNTTSNTTDKIIRWGKGDIFFGLDMQHHVQLAHKDFFYKLKYDGVIVKFLVYDLLPIELAELFKNNEHKILHEELMKLFAGLDGIISISKATSIAYSNWLNDKNIRTLPNFENDWVHIGVDDISFNGSKGLPSNSEYILQNLNSKITFLNVSTIEPRKKQEQILDAIEILWKSNYDINIIFVGHKGWKTQNLINRIKNHKEYNNRLFWLNGISDEYLEKIYKSSTCLISASINEGFGLPLIEAARYNLPIIARDILVFKEVADEYAYYFRGFKGEDLANSIKDWIELYNIDKHPKSNNMPYSSWKESTEILKTFLISSSNNKKTLFLDISELVQRDSRSGIQRVVRSIIFELFKNPPKKYDIKLVYATIDDNYRYATNFTYKFLGHNINNIEEKYINYKKDDIFFILDMQPQVQIAKKEYYQKLRKSGVKVQFLLYDLLSINLSHFFPKGNRNGFENWLQVMSENDKVICISKAVEDDYIKWLNNYKNIFIETEWFHLGADIISSKPSKGLPSNAINVIEKIKNNISFIMVGTLEPRKGYFQTLKAFTSLWKNNIDIILVIVGKNGWMVEELIEMIKNHKELNKKLFWLEGISDEYLEKAYESSDCLIASSEGEGFGLPLIEAAQYKKPIIARDIPVFREVAREYAYYFDNDNNPKVIEDTIKNWIELYKNDKHPKSDCMPWLTWEESTKKLLECFDEI